MPADSSSEAVAVPQSQSAVARAIEPLRDANYRDYWISNALFTGGQQMQMMARQWVMLDLTASRTLLGMVGFLGGAVSLVLSPVGGVIGDRLPQKSLLMLSRAAVIVLAVALGVLIAVHMVTVWQILLITLLAGAVMAISQPAAQTFVYSLVGRERLTGAIALNSVANGLFQTAGLAFGGVLIAVLSAAGNFFLAAAIFAVALFLLGRIPISGQPASRKHAQGRGSAWQELVEGLQLARREPIVFAFLLLSSTTIISVFPFTLRVVVAKDVLHSGPTGFGILSAAATLGSVAGAAIIALVSTINRKGLVVLISSLVKETCAILYGLSPFLWFSAFLDFVMGMYIASFTTLMMSLMQTEVPENMRNRALSLYFMGISGASFGNLLAGVTADALGDRTAIVLSGIIRSVLILLIFVFVPALRNQGRERAGVGTAAPPHA